MKKNKRTLHNFFQNRSRTFYIVLFIISSILIFAPLIFSFKFQELKGLGLLGVFLANFFGSASMFLPAPAFVTVLLGGSVYPPILLALIATVASVLGESVGFFFGLSTHNMTNFKKHKILYNLLNFTFHRYGWWIIIVISIIPNPFFDAIGILAGLSSYSIKKFLVAVFIGRLIRNIILAYFGQYLDLV